MAATMAAIVWPPAESTDSAATWADPANVIADMTMAAPPPTAGSEAARTPNEMPNSPTATASGRASKTGLRSVARSSSLGGGPNGMCGCRSSWAMAGGCHNRAVSIVSWAEGVG